MLFCHIFLANECISLTDIHQRGSKITIGHNADKWQRVGLVYIYMLLQGQRECHQSHSATKPHIIYKKKSLQLHYSSFLELGHSGILSCFHKETKFRFVHLIRYGNYSACDGKSARAVGVQTMEKKMTKLYLCCHITTTHKHKGETRFINLNT
jgi:hypothetical protein